MYNTESTKKIQPKEVAPMQKVFVCLAVLVGLVLGFGSSASAQPPLPVQSTRKILVIEEGTKAEVIALVERLGGTVINELDKIEGALIVDIPDIKKDELEAAREVLKVHDDHEVFIPDPRRLYPDPGEVEKRRKEGEREKQGFTPLENYVGTDWGYDRVDVEEIHWPGIRRLLSHQREERGFASVTLVLVGALGLVGAGLSRWRGRRGLFLALAFAGLASFLTGCAAGVVPIIEGAGVLVAILDTGIDFSHPDLNANVNTGLSRNCLTGTCVPGGADDHGHGTFVAGIIAAERRNTGDWPFDKKIGVAPKAELVAVKVCTSGGSCPASAILAGMNYVITIGAKVANMSLGTGTFARGTLPTLCEPKPGNPSGTGTGTYDPALRAMFVNNVTLVVAAGNHGGNIGPTASASLFASCRGTIAVAATSPRDQMASFSAYGGDVEIAAPGMDVFSTGMMTGGTAMCYDSGQGYCASIGTSFSAPYVTGTAALLYSIGTNTPTAVLTRLVGTADNVIAPFGPIQPEPLLDAEEAVMNTQNGDN